MSLNGTDLSTVFAKRTGSHYEKVMISLSDSGISFNGADLTMKGGDLTTMSLNWADLSTDVTKRTGSHYEKVTISLWMSLNGRISLRCR